MTIQHDTGVTPAEPSNRSKQVADTAASDAQRVASSAAEGAREVAGEVTGQAKAVASQARHEFDELLTRTRGEVRQQAQQRSADLASRLRTMSEQLVALAEGRTQGAGPMVGYVRDAQGQVRRLAARLEQGGPQGVMDDVTRFARRRPGVFLAGAVGAGFVIGRLVRAGASSQEERQPETIASVGPAATISPTPAVPLGAGDGTTSLAGNGPIVAETPLPPPAAPDPRI